MILFSGQSCQHEFDITCQILRSLYYILYCLSHCNPVYCLKYLVTCLAGRVTAVMSAGGRSSDVTGQAVSISCIELV